MSKPCGVPLALVSVLLVTAALGPAAAASPALPAAPGLWSLETLQLGSALSTMEYGTARSDHEEVAQAVARCGTGFENPVTWNAATRAVLLFELNETLGHGVQRPVPNETPGNVLQLTGFQKAAVSFSDKLSRDRLSYRNDLETSQQRAYWFQVATIVFGALATICIGIRSILDRNSSAVIWFAVAAIVASSASTAVATLNTFANYQTQASQANRTLAQLRQLHWRVVADVLKNNLVCAKDHDQETEKTNQVNSWRDRYEIISDSAVESLARPGDLSHPVEPPSAGTPSQKPAPSGAGPYKAGTGMRTTQR